ncbi:MAG: sensor protein [Thermoleophilia bacterium]|nr:sensor protein [Thermoleophilia bacterium]
MTPDAPAGPPADAVVVIDDDGPSRRLMRRILERRGFQVAEAEGGEAGLALIRAGRPPVVLLDLRMPGTLSGLDVLRVLREDPGTAGIPVVVVSASVDSAARSIALGLGAAAFLEKPVDFELLYETLARVAPDLA